MAGDDATVGATAPAARSLPEIVARAPREPNACLTESFILRDEVGLLAPAHVTELVSDERFRRFVGDVRQGCVEPMGLDYRLVSRPGGEPGAGAGAGAWLVGSRGDRIAFAYRFGKRADAAAALPRLLQCAEPIEVVDAAISAFASGDFKNVLSLLDPAFTYTDRTCGLVATGAAVTLTRLAVAQRAVVEHGLPELELFEDGEGVVRATGILALPGPDRGQRWTTLVRISDGRLLAAERLPNEEPAGP